MRNRSEREEQHRGRTHTTPHAKTAERGWRGGGVKGCRTGAEWQKQSHVGWVRVGQSLSRKNDITDLHKSHPTGHASAKWRTRPHTHWQSLKLYPHPTPTPHCQAFSSRIPVESAGWWSIVETVCCYKTNLPVTETDKYFPEATSENMGVEGRFLFWHGVNQINESGLWKQAEAIRILFKW